MALFTIGFHLYSVVPTPSFIHLNRPLSHEQVGAYLHSRNFADLLRHRKPYLYKGGSSQSFSVLAHLDTSPITRDYILLGYPHDLTSHSQSQSVLMYVLLKKRLSRRKIIFRHSCYVLVSPIEWYSEKSSKLTETTSQIDPHAKRFYTPGFSTHNRACGTKVYAWFVSRLLYTVTL